MSSVIDIVRQTNRYASKRIFEMKTTDSLDVTFSDPRVVFPYYRNGVLRISEQEARFAFVSVIEEHRHIFYSVETPTSSVHSFTGAGMRSALFDLNLYEHDTKNNKLNLVTVCEFKHGTKGIDKDIQKLASVPSGDIVGNWFHLIGSIDSGTVNPVFNKMADSLKKHSHLPFAKIIFHFCILKPKQIVLEKVLDYSTSALSFNDYVDEFFEFTYKVGAGKVSFINANGWF